MSPLTCLIRKICLNKSKFSPRFAPFPNLLRKTNFLSFSVLLSEVVFFWLKRELLCEFPPKYFKKTEKNSLAVWGSPWGEKHVFDNIYHIFTGLIKKSCLNKSKFFSGFTRFKCFKKQTFWVFQCSYLKE